MPTCLSGELCKLTGSTGMGVWLRGGVGTHFCMLARVLTTGLTDGGRARGAGGRAPLLKMLLRVPSCREIRADKLTDKRRKDRDGQSREKQPLHR